MYLLDSDFLINFLAGKENAIEIIKNTRLKGLYTSIICYMEVLEGLYSFGSSRKLSQFKEFIKTVNILNVDKKVADCFISQRRDLRKKGNLIDNFDLLIASTCLAYDFNLITKNTAHFSRVSALKIYKP